MKNLIVLVGVLIWNTYSIRCQNFEWAKSGVEFGNTIAVDSIGNVYTAGNYSGIADFDPGPGVFNLTCVGGRDAFLQKLDPNGNFLWAKSFGGNNANYGDVIYSIAVDADGFIYATGNFYGTADFDPGLGVFNLTSNNARDVFNFKLDENGNFIWAKSIGGSGDDSGNFIAVDSHGDVYTAGTFIASTPIDFDPGVGIYNLSSSGYDAFIQKLDNNGNFIWAKSINGSNVYTSISSIVFDTFGNVHSIGTFEGNTDFDPGVGTHYISSISSSDDIFVQKLDSSGNFIWAKRFGGSSDDSGYDLAIDSIGNLYLTGNYAGIFVLKLNNNGNTLWQKNLPATSYVGKTISVDVKGKVYLGGNFSSSLNCDPSLSNFTLTASNSSAYLIKFDENGNFINAIKFDNNGSVNINNLILDKKGSLYSVGYFSVNPLDVDPSENTYLLGPILGSANFFTLKLSQERINGFFFSDLNTNCQKDTNEFFLGNILAMIQPGNIIVQASKGIWSAKPLPIGNYTITIDTSGQWINSCISSSSFTIIDTNQIQYAPNIGLKNINPCSEPAISILAPTLRRCFTNQMIYVEAKNLSTASQIMYNSYADVKLDSFLTINSSTRSYISLGNYTYRFQLDSLYPGQSKTWQISTTVSCSVTLNQSLCMQANLFPVAPCVLDSTPTGTGCLGAWDNSFLRVTGLCDTDSIRFEIRNLGSGDMDCFRDIRLFIDGQFFSLDSIKLLAGGIHKIAILGDARTWRLEADQHPLVPGNSHPNATVELCGDSLLQSQNWISNKVNILPMDDADPVVDIYCGLVSGSYDPNDKTGYPLGVDFGHYILPNQQMQYVIRFQNTGTDTAFKVVIRDTLESDLNIFSVVSGVSSHNYSFRMFGPRILEWTFNNIMLPDSFHSEPNSHGFVTFTVEQNENLPSGTSIDNSAAIYFDFNAPVITNTSHHEIQRELLTTGVNAKVAKGDIKVYPNPNNGLFKVELPMPSTPLRQQKITICNVMGQVVYISTTLNDQSIEIDLSKQLNGIYFLKVENGEMEWNKKVVKN